LSKSSHSGYCAHPGEVIEICEKEWSPEMDRKGQMQELDKKKKRKKEMVGSGS